jgi:hypothetical protein
MTERQAQAGKWGDLTLLGAQKNQVGRHLHTLWAHRGRQVGRHLTVAGAQKGQVGRHLSKLGAQKGRQVGRHLTLAAGAQKELAQRTQAYKVLAPMPQAQQELAQMQRTIYLSQGTG